ncbi:MAG: serine/threonine protein kinase [Planctomycetota bacterium]|nr:MAG: serine/threonine protein kinase [Planctomycetota bacterium]
MSTYGGVGGRPPRGGLLPDYSHSCGYSLQDATWQCQYRPHTASMLTPGSEFSGLRIGPLLGRGAMGEVYAGEQRSLKRPVAIKRIAEHLIDEPSVLARFEREAQCIARVSSPHVLAVYEFGHFTDQAGKGHWLLVMELVEGGGNARELLRHGMDWRQATSIILQVAEGLAAAAEHGIVHRDIKPDNIMISSKGQAKLADFGLAKAADSHGMTMEGSLVGTPYYMPPEACRGEEVGHAGDLYSLGATWYHLLCGRPVFQDRNTMMLLRAHAEQSPEPIAAVQPHVPAAIAEMVHRCLAKDPQDRPLSAEQLAHELQALVAEGIYIPRLVPELMSSLGGPAVSTASTLKTSLADRGSAHLPSYEEDDRRMSTVAAEMAAAPASGPTYGLRHVVVFGLLALVVAVGIPLLFLVPNPHAMDTASDEQVAMADEKASVEEALGSTGEDGDKGAKPTDAKDHSNPGIQDQAQDHEPTPALTQALNAEQIRTIDYGLDRFREELIHDEVVEAWAWSERIPEAIAQDADRYAAWQDLRQQAVRRARELSAAMLAEGLALLDQGEVEAAFARFQHGQALATIGGEGERYQALVQRLRQRLDQEDGGGSER